MKGFESVEKNRNIILDKESGSFNNKVNVKNVFEGSKTKISLSESENSVDDDIYQYRDFEIVEENNRNFILKHKTDATQKNLIEIIEKNEGNFELVGLPEVLKRQLSVFNEENVSHYLNKDRT